MRSGIVCGWMIAASLFAAPGVRLDVSARPGLTAGDFRVTVDGVPQPLASVAHSSSGHVAVFVDLPPARAQRLLHGLPQGVHVTVFLWHGVTLKLLDGGRVVEQTEAVDREAVAAKLARLVAAGDGWRSIVWASDRFQFGTAPWSTSRLVSSGVPPRGALAMVNQAGIALYPVDLSSARLGEMASPEDRPVPGADRREWSGDPRPNPLLAPERPMSSAEYLAAMTGGAAFRGTRGIRAALRQVARDARSSYTVLFEPVRPQRAGRGHRIRVTAKGTLRYRRVYFDPGDGAPAGPAPGARY